PQRTDRPRRHAAHRTRGGARVNVTLPVRPPQSYPVARVPFSSTPPRRVWRALLRMKLALIDRRKYNQLVIESFDGMSFVVLPDVVTPKLLRSGEFLVRQLSRSALLPSGARVLDLGCGSGAAGIAAARKGCNVVAIDINPSAVRCARINALLNNV